MKIVYMGTPDFAVGPLEALLKAGHEITVVVTQPDKPKGRGKEVQYPPVKECAVKHNIPVLQPVKIKTFEAVEQLRQMAADVFVVAAFGQILSAEILTMPKYGCLNIHASLLPKYRGAAPINWVIIDGEEKTGVTIMQMDAGIDTGDMLLKGELPVAAAETAETLHDKLSALGADLIVEALNKLEQGLLQPQKQDDSASCYAKMLTKTQGHIDWNRPAAEIERLIRGLNSWPSAYTYLDDKVLKIWQSQVVKQEETGTESGVETGGWKPGSVVKVEKDAVFVQTGKDLLKITQLQLAGKKRLTVKEFLLGYTIQTGKILDDNRQIDNN